MQDMRVPRASSEVSTSPVFLHIGAMKTGTTFLQHLLVDNQDRLAEAGYLFPGETWKHQVRAAQEVLATSEDPVILSEAEGAWISLAQLMRGHDGAASLYSMEFLSHAAPDRVAWALEVLGSDDVHVVLTVRDATAIIPAQWQTTVRSGSTTSWPDFMRRVRRATGLRGRPGRFFSDHEAVRFRRNQDISHMLEVWGRFLPPDRLHVVTVPVDSSDPRLLWERFAQTIGVDPDLCPGLPPANESLGYTSTELLRRVNVALGEVPLSDYNATVREYLAGRVLAFEAKHEVRPKLDAATAAFGLTWNRRVRAGIERSGAQVVGELDDLPVSPTERQARLVDEDQSAPSEDELLHTAGTALEAMRGLVRRRARRAAKQGVDLTDLGIDDLDLDSDTPAWTETGPSAYDPRSDDPVADATGEIAALCHVAIETRRRMRG